MVKSSINAHRFSGSMFHINEGNYLLFLGQVHTTCILIKRFAVVKSQKIHMLRLTVTLSVELL